MRNRSGLSVLVPALGVGALAVGAAWFARSAFADQKSYKGGVVQMSKTGSGEATVNSTTTYTNDTGKPICDFVVEITGGGTGQQVKQVHVLNEAGSQTERTQFKVDDNGDDSISGTSEDDQTDSSAGKETHSISDGACIGTGATFSFSVTVSSSTGCTVNVQATGAGTEAGKAGSQLASMHNPSSGSPSAVAVLLNCGDAVAIVAGENYNASSMTSITFAPPPGVTVSGVMSQSNPGAWNSTTRTFTFSNPVPAAGAFSVRFALSNFDPMSEITEVAWTANF